MSGSMFYFYVWEKLTVKSKKSEFSWKQPFRNLEKYFLSQKRQTDTQCNNNT